MRVIAKRYTRREEEREGRRERSPRAPPRNTCLAYGGPVVRRLSLFLRTGMQDATEVRHTDIVYQYNSRT